MSTTRIRFAAIIVIAAIALTSALLGMAGCRQQTEAPKITSAWPQAESERVVDKPAEPPRWPLTGQDAPDEESTLERVVSVKIENSPAARPQTGLNSADVVYETVAEGGITRFNAMFHSKIPRSVGPVRSARLSDIRIVPQYGALFAFSGASASVNAAVRSANLENLSQDAGVRAGYSRSSARRAPHNLYLDISAIKQEAVRRGMAEQREVKGLSFDRRPVETTTTVGVIDVPFSQANRVQWTFDETSRMYKRVNNGAVHNDAADGQIAARNVVVMWARHSAASRDKGGSTTYEIALVGSGRGTIFRDGQKYDVTWTATADAPPTFADGDGVPVRLAPGNTWFQVVGLDVNISMR